MPWSDEGSAPSVTHPMQRAALMVRIPDGARILASALVPDPGLMMISLPALTVAFPPVPAIVAKLLLPVPPESMMLVAVTVTLLPAITALALLAAPPVNTMSPVAETFSVTGSMLASKAPAATLTVPAVRLIVPAERNFAGPLVPSSTKLPGMLIVKLLASTKEPVLADGARTMLFPVSAILDAVSETSFTNSD